MRSWYNGDSIVVVGNDIVIDLFLVANGIILLLTSPRDDKEYIGTITFYKDKRTFVMYICCWLLFRKIF